MDGVLLAIKSVSLETILTAGDSSFVSSAVCTTPWRSVLRGLALLLLIGVTGVYAVRLVTDPMQPRREVRIEALGGLPYEEHVRTGIRSLLGWLNSRYVIIQMMEPRFERIVLSTFRSA